MIFLDETGAKTNLTRLCGRAPMGQRVHACCPAGHWHTTTLIGALRLEGSSACMTIAGATDTQVFEAYIRRVLLPTLQPGDLVIMDNLSPHKNERILGLLAGAGVEVRFLPAYSPDLNPIEKMWSKVKGKLRTAEARTPRSAGGSHRGRPGLGHRPGRHELVRLLWL